MVTHSTDINVTHLPLTCLSSFLFLDRHQVLIAEKQGIKDVIRTMKKHSMHAGIQQHGCGVLWNLAVNGNTQKEKKKAEKVAGDEFH
jgi:hypothetical protein